MNESQAIPAASPVSTAVTRVSVEPREAGPQGIDGARHPLVRPRTDRLAIASALCGLILIVPVVSQVIGLGLGIASLVRIRRAKREGLLVGGRAWALTGIISSGFALLGWAATVTLLLALGALFSHTAESLNAFMPTSP